MDQLKKELQALTTELQELVQCPVCLSSLGDTHSLCKNGHGVCSSCKSKLTNCPTCREDFVLYKATLVNKIIERLPKPCSNKDKGCRNIMLSQDHEKYCEFRSTSCKYLRCNWTGCVRDLLNHGNTVHSFMQFNMSLNSLREFMCKACRNIDITGHQYEFYKLITFDGNIFWQYVCRDFQSNCIIYRLFHLPTSKPTQSYYLVTRMKNGVIEFCSSSKARYDLDTRDEEIKKYYDSGIIISDAELDNLANDGQLNYDIKIVTAPI